MIDVERCTVDQFKEVQGTNEFYGAIFGEALKNLIYKDKILEEQYPNGNITGGW